MKLNDLPDTFVVHILDDSKNRRTVKYGHKGNNRRGKVCWWVRFNHKSPPLEVKIRGEKIVGERSKGDRPIALAVPSDLVAQGKYNSVKKMVCDGTAPKSWMTK